MPRKLIAAVALAAFLLPTDAAHAWGHHGHSVIDRAALAALPADGPVFLRKYVDYIDSSSTIPDTWRAESEPFGKMVEDPNHGWFMEQFAFMHTIPRSRYEFVLALYRENQRLAKTDPAAAKKNNVRWTGTLPYAAIESYDHLVSVMRLLRSPKTKKEDLPYLEMTCAMLTWQLGHYIGDGGQPLHDTIHHDGWQGPNPHNYTTDHAVHARFESAFVDKIALSEADLLPRIPAVGHQTGDVFDLILAYLNDTHQYVEPIYQLDQQHAFDDPTNKPARDMVYSRTANAATMLRDLLTRAWAQSVVPQLKVVVSATDEANPRYNPETGSAPAAVSSKNND